MSGQLKDVSGASAWATWRITRVKKWQTEHPWKLLHPTARRDPGWTLKFRVTTEQPCRSGGGVRITWVLDDSEVHFPLWTCLVMDWHINSRKSSSAESPSTAAPQELHQLSLDAGSWGRWEDGDIFQITWKQRHRVVWETQASGWIAKEKYSGNWIHFERLRCKPMVDRLHIKRVSWGWEDSSVFAAQT